LVGLVGVGSFQQGKTTKKEEKSVITNSRGPQVVKGSVETVGPGRRSLGTVRLHRSTVGRAYSTGGSVRRTLQRGVGGQNS